MFRRDLLRIVRPKGYPTAGDPELLEGTEENGMISSGTILDPATGTTYPIENGYLDLLGRKTGADNIANLTNFLPGAGPLYEPVWRRRSLTLLTGENFPNERELEVITDIVRPDRGGLYLDLGCSAGLYARGLTARLVDRGHVIGIDISPSMLKEAARRARGSGTALSLVRADAENLPFLDASFSGVVCGGSLNEFGDPVRALRETRRVLAPGGRVAIMGVLKARSVRGRRLQRFLSVGGARFFEPEEVKSLLAHVGLKPDALRTSGAVFFAGATRP